MNLAVCIFTRQWRNSSTQNAFQGRAAKNLLEGIPLSELLEEHVEYLLHQVRPIDCKMPSAEPNSAIKTQRLCLYSQISALRHDQVLQILAGITASQPSPLYEQYLVFEQLKLPAASKKNHGTSNLRRSYQQLVRDVVDNASWKHRITDVPEPGLKQIISQSVSENSLDVTELDKFRPGSDSYGLVSQHYLRGMRFVHGNVVVCITTAYPGSTALDDALGHSPPSINNLPALDRSGSYIIEAAVRVKEGSSTALRDQATKELLAFAETLRGAIDFRVPDRLALDPRLKGP
jgi:mediator of RNA polymerase II transcription subunit 18